MVSINSLPDEILEFVLTYLPPYKDLEECRLVNKRWHSIVKNVVRRSKMNLNKGLYDFRLCWQAHRPDMESTSSPTIAGRFSHSAVYYDNSMYIFGGGSSSDTTFNDLWRFDLSRMQWVRPVSMGTYPSPKGSASMLLYRGQLILFGGWRYPSLHPPYQPWCLFSELHLYDLKHNRWSLQTTTAKPPPMAGHSATIHRNKMIVFGGYQIIGELNSNSNDTWCLDLQNFIWSQPKFVGNTKPPPRYGQFQTSLDDEHLLIIGGCGGPNSIFSDAWLLDMSSEVWRWKSIPVRNKKWSAAHMWCNPVCRVGNKLVCLGPTPNSVADFQLMKQQRPSTVNQMNPERGPQINRFDNQRLRDNDRDRRRANINNNNNIYNNVDNNINNGRAGVARNNPAPAPVNDNQPQPLPAPEIDDRNNQNNQINEDEAANRLQRNLALRCRENEPRFPKRFDEPYEDRFRMAAFSVQNPSRGLPKDHQERIRRMEEKMNAIRNSRKAAQDQQKSKEPSPKRVKRNVLSMFVCDISEALSPTDAHLQWLEYKNAGIVPGAPERLIMSSIVAGNGELILFGGVHKETLTDVTHQVSNSVYFLTAPKDIV